MTAIGFPVCADRAYGTERALWFSVARPQPLGAYVRVPESCPQHGPLTQVSPGDAENVLGARHRRVSPIRFDHVHETVRSATRSVWGAGS